MSNKEVEDAALKIQSVFRGFQVRHQSRRNEEESLPDLNNKDILEAAIKIQSAFRGFKVRDRINKNDEESLPDLDDIHVKDSAIKIQAAFRGFQAREKRKQKSHESLPDLSDKDILNAAISIQSAFRGFKVRKQQNKNDGKESFPDLTDTDVQDAAKKIQAAFRGFQVCDKAKQTSNESLPDLNDREVLDAAIKIQSAFRGFKVRDQKALKEEDILPDLEDKEVQDAAKKIQAAFRGFQVRDKAKQTSIESLPDLDNREVLAAAIKIQSAFRGFKVRDKRPIIEEETLPDLEDKEVQEAAKKIQAAFRGFQVRDKAKQTSIESLPDLDDREVLAAAIKIQSAFRGFKVRDKKAIKEEETLPDLEDKEVQDVAKKIQTAFRGFQVQDKIKKDSCDALPNLDDHEVLDAAIKIQAAFREFQVKDKAKQTSAESLPDLNDKEVLDAAIKIQSAFRGFKVRDQKTKGKEESLPDLTDKDLKEAAIKIQSVFRGFQVRDKAKKDSVESLPDLNDQEVLEAAIKIQSVFRGFTARQKVKLLEDEENDELPELCNAETLAEALKIQSRFKGHKGGKIYKVPMTPQPSIDFDNIAPCEMTGPLFNNSKRVPPVPTRYDSKQNQSKNTSQIVPTVPLNSDVPKSPLPARSNRLKEVSIPKVPQNTKELGAFTETNEQPIKPSELAQSQASEAVSFLQQTLIRKESLQNFFKKNSDIPSPDSPSEREKEKSVALNSEDAQNRTRSKSKERERKPLSLPIKKEETKTKIGGFFSSMFKKSEKTKVITPSSDICSPQNNPMNNVEFKFSDTPNNDLKKKETPDTPTGKKVLYRKESSSDTESAGSNDNLSRQASRDDGLTGNMLQEKTVQNQKRTEFSNNQSNGTIIQSNLHNSIQDNENREQDEDLKKDLIHVVLTAVEQNWLKQAPKPTLDKVKALQAPDSDPELENSERSTSEADYVKKKVKAQKSLDLKSDDEGAQLFKQESADGEFPYIETTLPEERKGIVTITPSNQRLSDCKLTSIDRPRSNSPRKPGKLEDYLQGQDKKGPSREGSQDKITVKLPRQESKSKILKQKTENESWDNFSAAGLQSQKRSSTNTSNVCKTHLTKGKQDWVDCEKLPETKKTVKKYSSEGSKHKASNAKESSLQTLSGTQIVSPEECSCDCHHDSPPRILSPTTSDPKPTSIFSTGGTKPKTNPRTSSVTARTKPIPSQSKGLGSRALPSACSNKKKPSCPPPVPIRTTSVTNQSKNRYYIILFINFLN